MDIDQKRRQEQAKRADEAYKTAQEYIRWCADRNMTQTQMAHAVGKSPAWASLLVLGRIRRPGYRTLVIMNKLMGR